LLKEIVNAEYPCEVNVRAARYLYHEGILRTHRICGIKHWKASDRQAKKTAQNQGASNFLWQETSQWAACKQAGTAIP